MDWFEVCARLALAAVFAFAAAGKLLDRSRSTTSLAEFGVPAPLVKPASFGLPTVELLVAICLLLVPTARAAATGALVLLAGFTGTVALAMRRGRKPDCHCFGSLGSKRIGTSVLIRNAMLAVIAAGVASRAAQPAIDEWLAQHSTGDLAILSLSTALAVATIAAGVLWNRNHALHGPAPATLLPMPHPVGSRAPGFRVQNVYGARITLKSLLRDSAPVALLFLSPGCPPCGEVLVELPRWQAPLARALPIHVVSSASREQTLAMATAHRLDHVLIDPRGVIATRYGIGGTPSALIIGNDGRLASVPETGLAAIEALIRRALDTTRQQSEIPPAPAHRRR